MGVLPYYSSVSLGTRTLLSVDQLWAEQRIDARFRDLHRLELPPSNGVCYTIPYEPDSRPSSLLLVSAASKRGGAGKASTVSSQVAAAALGFHQVSSSLHVGKLSNAQVGELMHRRGARDLSYNPEFHSRTKHVQRRHFFVRDMVEAFELVVPLVKTADNDADFFTKPMKPADFFRHRATLMNIKA